MRLGLFVTRLDLGGAQQVVLDLAAHAAGQGVDVTLYAGAGGALDDAARALPVQVQLLPWLPHAVAPGDALAVPRLAQLFRAGRLDVLHTHSSKAGALGRVAAKLARVPAVVHTVHGWSFNDTQSAATQRAFVAVEKACAKLSDALVCVSEHDRARGLSLHIGQKDQYRILRAGIDVERFSAPTGGPALRQRLGIPDGHRVVGTVANFKPQKGPLDCAEVAVRVLRARDDVHVVYAGDGPLRSLAEQRLVHAGVHQRAHLLGWCDDVDAVYAASDVFLLMSHFEGLPRSVLQAMAGRVPVVATAVDGTAEVVRKETGYPVARGDVAGAAEAVLAALEGDEGRAARAHAQLPAFSLAAMRDGHVALYEELTAPGARRARRSARAR